MINRQGLKILLFLTLSLSLSSQTESGRVERWINQVRRDSGLLPLEKEGALVSSSALYAQELSQRGVLSHLDKGGRGPLDRYVDQGGSALAVGEILGTKASETPLDELFYQWLASKTHRAQILNPRWNCIGIALVERGGTQIYVVNFSNSLLAEYDIALSSSGGILTFTPIMAVKELLFTRVIARQKQTWTGGDQMEFAFSLDSLPLFLEISTVEGEWGKNRFVITR